MKNQTYESRQNDLDGRIFGGIVLAAFLLYGVGSSMADRPVGIALVLLNSVVVTVAGMIGFRLLKVAQRRVGYAYLVGRVLEALLLGGGVVLAQVDGVTDANDTGYLLGMIALAVGSIPFFHTLKREGFVPQPLATWGVIGYAALGAGAAIELATQQAVAVLFAIPGGLFELTLGIYLVRKGFRQSLPSQRLVMPASI